MADRQYFVKCKDDCEFEAMTKEQILTAIAQAVSEGTISDIDTGFVTTIKTITGIPLRFFVGTQSAYDQLPTASKESLFAIITDDTTKADLIEAINNLSNSQKSIDEKIERLDTFTSSLKYGIEKNDFNFISDNGIWSPDPCGNYYSNKMAEINGVIIDGWHLKGMWIKDNKYIQFVISEDKIFMRKLDKYLGVRQAFPFVQIAGDDINSYAKLSSDKEEIGKYKDGYMQYSFDLGTILVYRTIYTNKLYIGDIIDGSVDGNIGIHSSLKTNYVSKYSYGSTIGYAHVRGKWRVCGCVGSDTSSGTQYDNYIIQRVE